MHATININMLFLLNFFKVMKDKSYTPHQTGYRTAPR